MIYSKERFVQAINAMKEARDFVDRINEVGSYKNFTDGYYVDFNPRICDEELCRSLEAMFDDKYETIEWFVFDLDYGALYKEGTNLVDGEEYPIRTAEDLYDYLTMMKGRE